MDSGLAAGAVPRNDEAMLRGLDMERRMARGQFIFLTSLTLVLSAVLAFAPSAHSQQSTAALIAAKPGEWRYLNADPQSTRYSPLDQINRDNSRT